MSLAKSSLLLMRSQWQIPTRTSLKSLLKCASAKHNESLIRDVFQLRPNWRMFECALGLIIYNMVFISR